MLKKRPKDKNNRKQHVDSSIISQGGALQTDNIHKMIKHKCTLIFNTMFLDHFNAFSSAMAETDRQSDGQEGHSTANRLMRAMTPCRASPPLTWPAAHRVTSNNFYQRTSELSAASHWPTLAFLHARSLAVCLLLLTDWLTDWLAGPSPGLEVGRLVRRESGVSQQRSRCCSKTVENKVTHFYFALGSYGHILVGGTQPRFAGY